MRTIRCGLLAMCLPVLFTGFFAYSRDLVWNNDFSQGLRGWALGTNADLKRDGRTMFIHLLGPKGAGIADCKSPVIALDGAKHEYELTCTYRTDVQHSQLHGGAWFIFYKLNADKKLVGHWTGLLLKPCASWRTVTGRITIPAGTTTFQTAARVQSREGKTLDIRAVSLRKIK